MSAIEPGLYRLTFPVSNPHADRRMTRDWRKRVTWAKGTVFAICRTGDDETSAYRQMSDIMGYSSQYIFFQEDGQPAHRGFAEDGRQFAALWPHLQRIEPQDVGDLLVYNDRIAHGTGSARHVLDALFLLGKVSKQDILEALEYVDSGHLDDANDPGLTDAPEEVGYR